MTKKTRRNILRIGVLLFWAALIILARSERFKADKDPYVYAIVALSFVGYIIYENFFRLPKIEQTKRDTRVKQLSDLLGEKEKYQPKIKKENVPTDFQVYIPIAMKWGLDNKILREHLYESANHSALIELKKIEIDKEKITDWVVTGELSNEKSAFKLTLNAYDELGLWTWDNAKDI